MQPLALDPPVPFPIPDRPILLALIGCGGTGSHLAQALARLASHLADSGGPPLTLCFIDGDQVEAKNVGRQLFSRNDIGQNKAQVLAARFNAVFGLRITAVPAMADLRVLTSLIESWSGEPPYRVLVGCVDGAAGRKTLASALDRHYQSWHLWLDCGNHEASGQVCVGSTMQASALAGAFAVGGLCAGLPAPGLQYPELLKPAKRKRRQADCAAAMQDNAQSLQVNQLMAAIAGQYAYQIAVSRRLTTFQTTADLTSLSMRSLPITARQVAAVTGLPLDTLTTAPTRKGRAA